MKTPLLTIVTATLNCESFLGETLESVLNQGLCDIECIVVDGVSQDKTVAIIKQYEKKFLQVGVGFRWISEKDKGIYDALNKGIRMAKGEYIIFMGAGDYFFPNIFHKIEKVLATGKHDFVYGNVYVVRENIIYNGKYDPYKITVWPICHQAIFYKTNIFERLGYYDVKYLYMADCHLNIKCFSPENKLSIQYVKHIISAYKGEGASDLNSDIEFEKDADGIIQKYLGDDVLAYYKTTLPKRFWPQMDRFIKGLLTKQIIDQKDKFVIYGTANWGQQFYEMLIGKNMQVIAFSDSKQEKWGTKYNGIEIIPPDLIKNTGYDKILIASSSWAEIRDNLIQMAYKEEDILYLSLM